MARPKILHAPLASYNHAREAGARGGGAVGRGRRRGGPRQVRDRRLARIRGADGAVARGARPRAVPGPRHRLRPRGGRAHPGDPPDAWARRAPAAREARDARGLRTWGRARGPAGPAGARGRLSPDPGRHRGGARRAAGRPRAAARPQGRGLLLLPRVRGPWRRLRAQPRAGSRRGRAVQPARDAPRAQRRAGPGRLLRPRGHGGASSRPRCRRR